MEIKKMPPDNPFDVGQELVRPAAVGVVEIHAGGAFVMCLFRQRPRR